MVFQMNSPEGKAILARVRRGDYAHPGEEAAIELISGGVERLNIHRLLDVGCGRGGTAAWFHRHNWGQVTGVDVDATSIDYARKTYPGIEFIVSDVCLLKEHNVGPFDFVYLLNSFYAFPDQSRALQSIRSVCRSGSQLCIFDYARTRNAIVPAALGSDIGNPIVLEDMPDWLTEAGWTMAGFEDCTEKYVVWYDALLAGFERERNWIDENFGEDWRRYVLSWYGELRNALADQTLHGVVFKAIAS